MAVCSLSLCFTVMNWHLSTPVQGTMTNTFTEVHITKSLNHSFKENQKQQEDFVNIGTMLYHLG